MKSKSLRELHSELAHAKKQVNNKWVLKEQREQWKEIVNSLEIEIQLRKEGIMRDITQTQFDKLCKQYGFKSQGFLGYYDVGKGLSICALNAGSKRRDQIAYLIQQRDKFFNKKYPNQ